MTSALVYLNGTNGSAQLVSDLQAAGVQVVGVVVERNKLVQEVVRHAPDMVVCDDPLPGEALFKLTGTLAEIAPRPVIVFTTDGDADHIVRAIEAGIHAYVVNGYSASRLRSLIHLAQARFQREQTPRYLNDIPLSTPGIRAALAAAAVGWQQMLAGAADARHPAGQETVASASETLLEEFDQLSGYDERSMQMLVG